MKTRVVSKFEQSAADPASAPRLHSHEPALGHAPDPGAEYMGRLVVELWSVSQGDGIAYAAIGNFRSAKEADNFARLAVDKLGRRLA